MPKTIQVTERIQLRRSDESNWQVWEYRTVNGKDGKTREEWKPMGRYYGQAYDAVHYILDNAALYGEGTITAKELAEAYWTAATLVRNILEGAQE